MTTMTDTIPVNNNVSEHHALTPWVVVLTAALFFFYEYIQLMMFNAINFDLRGAFGLDAGQVGFLAAASLIANVVLLFPAGMLLDRFSTKKLIVATFSTCVIGTLMFAMAHSFAVAAVARFITGIGSAFCFLAPVTLASRWFPSKRLALIVGLIVTMAMIGGMVAQTPFTLLVNHFGWRQAVYIDAGVGVVILALISLFVKDYPANYDHAAAQAELVKMGFWASLRKALLRTQNWLGGIYSCIMNFPIILLGAVWGAPYIERADKMTATDATMVTAMIFIGTIFGSPIMGLLSDRLGRRRIPMLIGALVCVAIVSVIIYVPHQSWLSLMILFGLLGFVSSTQVISYPIIAESNPAVITATAISVISFTVQGGGALFQPIFGIFLDKGWHGQTLHGVAIYSAHDFQRAMILFPIGFLLAFFVAYFMRETYCKSQYAENNNNSTLRH